MKDLEFLFHVSIIDIEVGKDENDELAEYIIGEHGYKIYSLPETNMYILVSHNGFIAMYSEYLEDVFEYLEEELNSYFINQDEAQLLSESENTKVFRLWADSSNKNYYTDMAYVISSNASMFLRHWFDKIGG